MMKAYFKLDWRKLEKAIDQLWSQWDKDGSGYLEQATILPTPYPNPTLNTPALHLTHQLRGGRAECAKWATAASHNQLQG